MPVAKAVNQQMGVYSKNVKDLKDLKSGARHTCFIGRLSLPDRAFVFGLPVNVATPPAQQSALKPASIRKT